MSTTPNTGGIVSMEQQYLNVMAQILEYGVTQSDRTGTGTKEIWAPTLRCDLEEGFPLITTKKVFFNKVVSELVWMIRGLTNVKHLHAMGNHIWDEWADEDGELGPVYGAQWRAWEDSEGAVIDQLGNAVDRLKTNPACRRIIVNSWNVGQLAEMRLPPCHLYYQFNVQNGRLNTLSVQRSADWFIGVPFNIAQYAALTHAVAHIVGLKPGKLVMQFGSAHLYLNHLEQARTQLRRKPFRMPTLRVEGCTSLDNIVPASFKLSGYAPADYIKADVSV